MTDPKNKPDAKSKLEQSQLVLERVFNAPRQRVWKAWTDPAQLTRWWGPKIFTAPVCRLDFRVGGKYLYCMRSPEGQDFWSGGVFREIAPYERFVFTDSFSDEHGTIVPGSYYGMGDDYPLELLVTVSFADLEEGKTKMTLRHDGLPAGELHEMTGAGWNESFDKLAESLKS